MGRPKNHHYVPQFYLRKFSPDRSSICLLNKARDIIVEKASIKGQCAVENLHGWHDDAEAHVGQIESACSPTIDRILRDRSLPIRGSMDFENLLVFVALQRGRTLGQAEANNRMVDYYAKLLLRGRPEVEGVDLDRFEIRETFPVAIPMSVSLQVYQYFASLRMNLIASSKTVPFITSDDPVVLYNASRAHVWWEGVTGVDSEGLQVFFPLSRHLCLYLYDPHTYAGKDDRAILQATIEDTLKINALTILQSQRNLYGFGRMDLELARMLRNETAPFEKYERVAFNETEEIPEDDGKTGSLIATYTLHPPAKFQFRFARPKAHAAFTGVRSDRSSGGRRAKLADGGTTRSYAVVKSTISAPRPLLRDGRIKSVARRIR